MRSIYDTYGILIKYELEDYHDYLKETSNFYKTRKSNVRTKILKISNYEEPKGEAEDYNSLLDQFDKYENVFTRFTFNSNILSLFGFFEYWLQKICESTYTRNEIKIKLNDLKGDSYIGKSKLFLEKVIELDLSNLEKDWSFIKRIQRIRNLIAHEYSHIHSSNKSNKDILTFIAKNESIEYDEELETFFCKDEKLVINLINSIRHYLIEICKKLKFEN